jgi:signal transduction histidine kinase
MRLESSTGKLQLSKEHMNLANVIHNAAEAIRPTAEGLRHQLVLTLPAEQIYVDADPMRLA